MADKIERVIFISSKGASIEKSGLHELYKVENEKWEDAVIRTQGSSETVKAIDTAKQVKEPLTKKYKEWQGILLYFQTLIFDIMLRLIH